MHIETLRMRIETLRMLIETLRMRIETFLLRTPFVCPIEKRVQDSLFLFFIETIKTGREFFCKLKSNNKGNHIS